MSFSFVVNYRKLKQYLKSLPLYFKRPFLHEIDSVFKKIYKHKNPYRICHEFFKRKGLKDPFVYGETPLFLFNEIGDRTKMSQQSVVLDLGCGSGIGLFYLNTLFGCRGIGIDCVKDFIENGKKASLLLCKDKEVAFECKDLEVLDFPKATHIYLAGTCMEEALIEKIGTYLSKLSSSPYVITISFPLSDYVPNFKILEEFKGEFLWGKTSIFIQKKGDLA